MGDSMKYVVAVMLGVALLNILWLSSLPDDWCPAGKTRVEFKVGNEVLGATGTYCKEPLP